MRRPMTPGSDPNRCCHSPFDNTTTFVFPGVSSSAANVRPNAGLTRRTSNSDALTSATSSRTGSPSPVRIFRSRVVAAALSSDLLARTTSKKFGPDITTRCPSDT